MPFVVLAIGAILLIAALNNSQTALAGALETDIPAYLKWALAIALIGALGFIPGLKPISRGLMALVLAVIVLKNYAGIISGFRNATTGVGSATASTSSESGVSGDVLQQAGQAASVFNGLTGDGLAFGGL